MRNRGPLRLVPMSRGWGGVIGLASATARGLDE
jgi:hypothetical protein